MITDINYDLGLMLVRSFIVLFVIMDSPGNIPIFIALTKGMRKEERKKELRYAVIIAAVLLLLFALIGKIILDVLGITIDSFMIAGGILLLLISFDLLRGEHRYAMGGGIGANASAGVGAGVGAVPLGIPLLAGPGAITAVMVIVKSYGLGVVLFAIFSAIIASWLVLGQSDRLYNLMGKVGSDVLSRVVGIIVAAIAIQFIGTGIIGMF